MFCIRMTDPVLNAYGQKLIPIPIGQTYSNYYPLIRRVIIIDKLKRELLHLYQEMSKERATRTRSSALTSRRRSRAQLTGGAEYNFYRNRLNVGRSSAKLRNLETRYAALKKNIAKLEAGNGNWRNYSNSMLERIYNSYSRIHPRFKTGSKIPHFAPSNWSLSNFSHTEKIPRNYIRKLLLGQPLPEVQMTQKKQNYLNALRNTVMRKIVNAQQRFRVKKAKETGQKIGTELSFYREMPRPVMKPSNVVPNAVLRPSQMKLANRMMRAPLKRNNFNSVNAYMNYLIKGPYASTANKGKHKRAKFGTVKKYFEYLVAGAPNNWNNF